jgi:hypothetical protein
MVWSVIWHRENLTSAYFHYTLLLDIIQAMFINNEEGGIWLIKFCSSLQYKVVNTASIHVQKVSLSACMSLNSRDYQAHNKSMV